jgi:RHS repeat-associated protein
LVTVFLMVEALSFAQSPDGPGRAMFGSYASNGIDTINLYNGNVMFDVTVFSLPAREGLSTELRLVYNQQGWTDASTPSGTYGYYTGGWRIATPVGGAGTDPPRWVECIDPGVPWEEPTGIWAVDALWIDPTGAIHRYEPAIVSVSPELGGCDQFSWLAFNGAWVDPIDARVDGTVTYIHADGNATVYLTSGLAVGTIPGVGYGIETRNGNYAELDFNSGLLTDTLGRTITFSSGIDTSGENYKAYTLKDFSGTERTYRLNYIDCLAVHNPVENGPDCIQNLLKAIILPNGRKYAFEYGHDQGFLTRFTLPTGAYTRYNYANGNTSLALEDDYVVERRVSADGSGGGEQPWTYTRTTSPSLRTTTVQDPLGRQIVHNFNSNGNEIETLWRENSSSSPVQTILTTWTNGQPETIITRTQNLEKRQVNGWGGTWLHWTTQSDWYGIGQAVIPLAKTINTYSIGCAIWPCNMHFPSKVELQQWIGGSYFTQGITQYFYNQNPLTATSGVPNHHPPTVQRWNLTTVRRYRDASDSAGIEEHFYYDDAGNIVQQVDSNGKSTYVSYADKYTDTINRNSAAFPTLVSKKPVSTESLTHEVETEYDFNTGLPAKVFDPRDIETRFTYDLFGRNLSTTELIGPPHRVTSYVYTDGPAEQAIFQPTVQQEVTAQPGVVRKVETVFDLLHRPVQAKRFDPDGHVFVTTEYDETGHIARVSAPYRGSAPTAWNQAAYDVLGRTLEISNPDSTTVTFGYVDNIVTTTDEAANSHRQTFNALGQLVKVEEPDPASGYLATNYSYSALGLLHQVSQGAQTRTFTHNWLGWKTQESHPETGTTSYTHDAKGMVLSRTDARNIQTNYVYDDLGRLRDVEYASTPDVHYTYDQNNFTGLVTSIVVDGVMGSTFSYTPAGLLASETIELAGVTGSFLTAYEYDLDGRLTEMTYPSSRVVTQSYVNSGGIATDRTNTLMDSTTLAQLMSSITDNAAGAITARTIANNIAETRSFNARNQLTRIKAERGGLTLMDLGYGYGANNDGRIRSRTDAVQPEHSANYSFDEIGRLRQVTGVSAGWGISWMLDRYGNRTAQTSTGLAGGLGSQSSFYGNPNTTNRNTAFGYDSAGNMTNDGSRTYTYDAENRLVQINSSNIQYAYDYAGRRIRRKVGNVTTYYFYGLTGLTSEFSTVTGVAAAASTDRLQYRVGEQTGTAVMLLDSAGVPRENNRVFPFGESWVAFSGSTNNEKFTTYQRDAENGEAGLDYAVARYYASRSGRFMTPDPGHVGARAEDPQSWNAYAYGANDPINHVDPRGTKYQVFIYGNGTQDYEDSEYENLYGENFIGGHGVTMPNPVERGSQSGFIGWIRGTDGYSGIVAGQVWYTYTSAEELYDELEARRDASNQFLAMATVGSAGIGAGAGVAPAVGGLVVRGSATLIGSTSAMTGGTGVVIGAFNQPNNYLELAKAIGANAFNLSMPVWKALNYLGVAWHANKAFLNTSVARGQQLYLATAPLLKPGIAQTYQQELQYLKSIGVTADKWKMLRQ